MGAISNCGQCTINEVNMSKLNNGANMKESTENTATAHILVRSLQAERTDNVK